jgi:hypothetical protein
MTRVNGVDLGLVVFGDDGPRLGKREMAAHKTAPGQFDLVYWYDNVHFGFDYHPRVPRCTFPYSFGSIAEPGYRKSQIYIISPLSMLTGSAAAMAKAFDGDRPQRLRSAIGMRALPVFHSEDPPNRGTFLALRRRHRVCRDWLAGRDGFEPSYG